MKLWTIVFTLCGLLLATLCPAADKTWTGAVSTDWFNSTNWTPAGVPSPGDHAIISSDAAEATAPVTISAVNLNGGNLIGTSGITVTNFTWSSGTLSGDTTLVSTSDWSGGTLSGVLNVASNGVLTLSGGSTKVLYGALTNAGTITWSDAGDLFVANDGGSVYGAIINLAGALFNIQNDQNLNVCCGSEFFNNAGTVRKSAGTDTSSVNSRFNNTGTVDVQTGTLGLNGGGAGIGTFNVPANATIIIGGGYTFNSGAVITGAGTNRWTGGTVTVDGGMTAQNVQLAGATLSGTNSFTGTVTWSDGMIDSLARVGIATNAALNLSGRSTKVLYGVLTNAGTVTWRDTGDLAVYNDGVSAYGAIINLAGALFDIQNDQNLNVCCGSEFFNNAGTVRKSAGTDTSSVNSRFNNTGTVDVQTGAFSLNGGGAGNGTFNVPANATIIIGAGYAFNSGVVITGAGTNRWTGGTVTVDGGVTAQNVQLAGATLSGTNSFAGMVTWSDGMIGSLARVGIATNAALNLSGGSTKVLYGVLTNAGTVTWSDTGDLFVANDGVSAYGAIINLAGGLFNIQNDQTLLACCGSEFFNNAGTVRKSAGSGTNNVNFRFNNAGTVDVQTGTLQFNSGYTQTAGLTRLSGGSLGSGPTINILSGVLSGYGTINADVCNGGEINPGGSFGTLTINGSLNHGGRLNLELGGLTAGTQYDVLAVANSATLGGWLSIRLKNGYRPGVGDSFEILRYGLQVGNFGQIFGLDLGAGLVLQPSFGSTSLVLLATNGPVQLNHLTFAPWENGTFDLRFTGLPDSNYVIQASSTLTNWLNLFTNSNSIGVIEYLDVDAPFHPQRFYRARLVP